MWDTAVILDAIVTGLHAAERRLAEEQAVYGLDALPETALHITLERALSEAGFGVIRERVFPSAVAELVSKSARPRCDFVVLRDASKRLADEDAIAPARSGKRRNGDETPMLFGVGAAAPSPACEHRTGERVPAEEAFWLEVKVVGQFTFTRGVPGPNAAYSGEITGSLTRDLSKLTRETDLPNKGLLLVLFVADETTARHDLTIALHRTLDREIEVRGTRIETFPIANRIGNGCCALLLATC